MKVLVAYASRHGATRGIAERIAQTLGESGYDATCQDVGEVHSAGLYDAFVIGASAYMGHWEKEATAFVRQHSALLSNRPVWIFSSGPVGPDRFDAKGRDQLEAARPREFAELPGLVNPRELKIFFGAYDPLREGGTLVERLIMKAPAIRDAMPAGDFRDWPAIEAWARDIARALEADRARLAVPV